MRNPTGPALLLASVVLLGGCSSPRPEGDGGDAGLDGGDGGLDADQGDAEAEVEVGPPPVAPETELEPVPIEGWLVGVLPGSSDPYRRQILAGTFELPAEGLDEHDVRWVWRSVRDDGVVAASGSTGWALTRVEGEQARRIVARADNVESIFGGRSPQPGDLYATRRMRVPLLIPAGGGLVAAALYGARGAPSVELFQTPDELRFNLEDLTVPDLVVGRDDEAPLGVAVLNLTDGPVLDLIARVVESDDFAETSLSYHALAPKAVTQVGFLLRPRRPWSAPDETVRVRLHLESRSLEWAYEREVELATVPADAPYRQTFVSPDDGSVQYYGVRPPADFDPERDYALVLSLHGAGVDAIGQARAYSSRDWCYLVAPTNRRPFGFDWEEWGRANGLYALDDAMARFRVEPSRVHLTGHSMGGHGTWHVGVTTPGRFATLGPSAGWSSFYSYTGYPRPTGALARARAHSDTMVYLGNLSRRGVYIIHGEADDNVPVREGREMYAAVRELTDEVVYHEEPGAGHWWDGEVAPGADCVDWPELFEFMRARTLDPLELDFELRSPSPTYAPSHSYVTLQSAETPYRDLELVSARLDETTVSLTTVNVRSMELDGAGLRSRGVTTVVVDGVSMEVPAGSLRVGPEGGKTAAVGGPFNQVFQRPFCYLWPEGAEAYRDFASFSVSYWSIYGNGHGCGLPIGELDGTVEASRNLVFLGVPRAEVGMPEAPFGWDESRVRVSAESFQNAGLLFVFPRGQRLAAALATTVGSEHVLYSVVPFSSRAGLPDYFVWSSSRSLTAGYLDADWRLDPGL